MKSLQRKLDKDFSIFIIKLKIYFNEEATSLFTIKKDISVEFLVIVMVEVWSKWFFLLWSTIQQRTW